MVRRAIAATVLFMALVGPARAEKFDLSYNNLVARGMEFAGAILLPTDVAKAYNEDSSGPTVVVHLRKGGAVGLCYFGLTAWINADADTLDNAKYCDLRTSPGQLDTQFEFLTPVTNKAFETWRVNRHSGEIGMCYYARANPTDPVGGMFCPRGGENAGVQKETGPYGLIQPQYENEQSIFRVNQRTGSVSLCFPFYITGRIDRIVCTEAAR